MYDNNIIMYNMSACDTENSKLIMQDLLRRKCNFHMTVNDISTAHGKQYPLRIGLDVNPPEVKINKCSPGLL